MVNLILTKLCSSAASLGLRWFCFPKYQPNATYMPGRHSNGLEYSLRKFSDSPRNPGWTLGYWRHSGPSSPRLHWHPATLFKRCFLHRFPRTPTSNRSQASCQSHFPDDIGSDHWYTFLNRTRLKGQYDYDAASHCGQTATRYHA
jgi:hypothetical protein